MKVNIYLTKDGQESLVKTGKVEWSWHYHVVTHENLEYGGGNNKDNILLCEGLELPLPAQEAVLPAVVARMRARIDEIYSTAAAEANEVKEELNKLLAIEHQPS